MSDPVVITGVGAVTPLGAGADVLHRRWVAGESAIQDGIAPCSWFTAADHLDRKDARRMDRFSQFAVVAADEAVAMAGLAGLDPRARVATIVGTGIGGLATIEGAQEAYLDRGDDAVSPLAIPLMMSNAAPAAVAMRHGFRGMSFGVVGACAAGAQAIGTAIRLLQCGDADVIVTGGSEAALTPLSRAGFGALGATSKLGRSRPFDARRDGFVMGEGAGVLVLERRSHAEARGATILAEATGFGQTSDAHHLTAPLADGSSAAEAISLALADAGAAADQVDYVNAHGTSTPLNDAAETAAIKLALGDATAHTPVSSTKSVIGHLLGAAGAVEAVATVLALQHRLAGATVGLDQPDPALDLDHIRDVPRVLGDEPLVALSNSFGFGGHNTVLAFASA